MTKKRTDVPNDTIVMKDILVLVAARCVLKELALKIQGFEDGEAQRLFKMLIKQIEMLAKKDTSWLPWRQAVANMEGIQAYGLERIGLWPVEEGTKDA